MAEGPQELQDSVSKACCWRRVNCAPITKCQKWLKLAEKQVQFCNNPFWKQSVSQPGECGPCCPSQDHHHHHHLPLAWGSNSASTQHWKERALRCKTSLPHITCKLPDTTAFGQARDAPKWDQEGHHWCSKCTAYRLRGGKWVISHPSPLLMQHPKARSRSSIPPWCCFTESSWQALRPTHSLSQMLLPQGLAVMERSVLLLVSLGTRHLHWLLTLRDILAEWHKVRWAHCKYWLAFYL